MKVIYFRIRHYFSAGSEWGMTLLEVLLAAAVFSVIFAAVLNLYSGGLRSWSKGCTALDLQQNARIALYEITQELRYAAGIEGFEDEDILPLCRGEEQPGQGSRRLIYTSVEGRKCEINFDATERIITVKKANGPRNEIACQVDQLNFFRYFPEMKGSDNPSGEKAGEKAGEKGISPMILVILNMQENYQENYNGENRGNPYILQGKIRLLNMPR